MPRAIFNLKQVFTAFLIAIVMSAIASAGGFKPGDDQTMKQECRPGVLIVKFKKSASYSKDFKISVKQTGIAQTGIPSIDILNEEVGVREITKEGLYQPKNKRLARQSGIDRTYIFKVPEGTDIKALAKKYKVDTKIEYAEPDWKVYPLKVPNDTYYAAQWGHNNTAQMPSYNWGSYRHDGPLVGTVGFDANAQAAWDNAQGYGSSSMVIGIIDTGVDWAHPDLRIWQNTDEIPGNGIDDDANGKIDDIRGWDFGSNDNNPDDDSSEAGHGTACSGVAVAVADNNLGVAGVAGGCTIMPLKVANNAGALYYSAINNALYYGADNGAKVLSMSLGGTSFSQTNQDACNYAWNAGAVVLAATGNENDQNVCYPAANANVIAVGAASNCDGRKRSSSSFADLNPGVSPDPNGYTCDGERWWGSNYSSSAPQDSSAAVDVIAPTILPTTDISGSGGYEPGDYEMWFNGTSCSTPYTAGVCALIFSKNPTWTPTQVRNQLVNTARDIVNIESIAGWDKYSGYGLVDAGASVGSCTYTLSPTNRSHGTGSETGSVSVAASASSCIWTAVSNAAWITVTSGSNGTGDGTVAYSVSANTGTNSRTGTITIAGRTFTVTQSGTCTYAISPTNQSFGSSGGTGSVGITTLSGCTWTAMSNATTWITITSGNSGTGNGTVAYSVAANTSISLRTGTMTIAGQTFTVTQSGITPVAIGDAVDNTSLSWTTGGDANWFGQSANYFYGGDAAQSGAITDNKTSWVQTSVTGPGTLTFHWKVSSEVDYDWLRFYIDGVEQTGKISGTVDWQQQTFSIASGIHTLKWAYTKDLSVSGGSDAGWVDKVIFSTTCTYSISPINATSPASGGSGSVSVTAGSGCSWTAVSNAAWITVTSGSSGTGNGTVGYSVAANISTSSRTGTMTIVGQTFTVTQSGATPITVGDAVDNTSLSWTTGGDANWFGQSANYFYGGDAAQSGIITDNKTSWVQAPVTGPGTLTFYWKVSSEADYDWLRFYIDGVEQTGKISGTVDWQQQTFSIASGSHTLKWAYIKDNSISSGSDTGWLDKVVFSGTTCTYSISPNSATSPASGGSGSANVTAGSGCSWTAVTNAAWITVTSGGSGAGNGTVAYSVAANPGTSSRTGTMTIAGRTFTVTQNGTCTYSLSPTSQSFSTSGGTGIVGVMVSSGCSWTAVSNATWITVTAGGSGTGNGKVAYSVSANPGTSSRTGTMTIAGRTFSVTQNGTCMYAVSPASQYFSANGGIGSVGVTTSSGCSWTVVSSSSWITITSGSSGTGNGTVAYSVSANTSASSRTGAMTIAGKTFSVTQNGSCTYAISPTSQSISSSGATCGSIDIMTTSGCSWTAVSKASWITITSGSSGTGNGTVAYSVSANTSTSSRTGTMTIAGQAFTVIQNSICTYVLSPAGQYFSANGGTGSVDVTTPSGSCSWTAVSSASWITITFGNGGMGNGMVAYSVSANTGTNSRTGTMTIAGRVFSITQEGTCTYAISPTGQSFSSNGDTGSVDVTTLSGCSWTAVSSVSWITITSGSGGAGNGMVVYSVSANTGTSPRTGTMTIAGRTFTVTQEGTCTYAISPTSQSFSSSGGTGSVDVTASSSSCSWTAVSSVAWITVPSGNSGTGNGMVAYSVAANTGTSSRTGTMIVAGRTFTITQNGI